MRKATKADAAGKVIPIGRDLRPGTAEWMRATLRAAGIPDALIAEREALCQAGVEAADGDDAETKEEWRARYLRGLVAVNDFDFVLHPEVGRAILKKPRRRSSHNAPLAQHPGIAACDSEWIDDDGRGGEGRAARVRRGA